MCIPGEGAMVAMRNHCDEDAGAASLAGAGRELICEREERNFRRAASAGRRRAEARQAAGAEVLGVLVDRIPRGLAYRLGLLSPPRPVAEHALGETAATR